MVEIEYSPVKKIVVHEIYRYDSKEELTKRLAGYSSGRPIFWCDGIVFVYYMDDSDDSKNEYLKGTAHWSTLAYAEMPKFAASIELEEGMFKGVKMAVIDYNSFKLFKDFIKWLKTSKQQ